jgi:hypothetical protein
MPVESGGGAFARPLLERLFGRHRYGPVLVRALACGIE